jgi:hypothetical protein
MPNPKHLSQDVRIRGIVQKHMTALSQEIAAELTHPLLAHWGLAHVEPGDTPDAEGVPEAAVPKALLFDRKTRKWVCPRCGRFSDLRRRSVTAHLRFCDVPLPAAGKRVDLRAWQAQQRAANRKLPVPARRRPSKKKQP